MGICDLPVISGVCETAGEAAASLVSAPFDWLAQAMGSAAGWLFEAVWNVFDATTLVDITSDGYLSVYNLLFGIAVFVMLLFFCLQLITGLIQHYVSGFDQLITQAGDEPGAATRAYLRSAAQPAPRLVLALLAAAISNPAALESLNQRYTAWQRRLDHDGIPPHVATLVRCAIDGLWLAETFDLAAPNPATRSRMLAELEKLID